MVYIIVPTFGRVEDTKSFLSSVSDAFSELSRQDYEVILTDDHPQKLTFYNIKENENVKVITSDDELWWVGSVNMALSNLLNNRNVNNDDIVIIANNDVLIDKNCLYLMMSNVEEEGNAFFHPRTFDQNNCEVSSGSKVLSLFPYITHHPKNFDKEKVAIEMGTARFLCTSFKTIKKIGLINNNLKHYGGDNDLTLRAFKKFGIRTYIIRDAVCRLDDENTGVKNMNIISFKELFSSYFSVRSPNNIYFRYQLFRGVYNPITAFFVASSLTFNSFAKLLLKKCKL